MITAGLEAVVTCVDPKQLAAAYSGRFLCAQHGHDLGETVTRDGFVFTDLLPG